MNTPRKHSLILVFLLLNFFSAFRAQNEAINWHFGYGAALSFSSNPPSISSGSLNTNEGCASISDAAGNLLFYTDGVTIYNQTHAVMANGTGLFGHPSTTQSALIVKQPGTNNLYYVFTQDYFGDPNGFCYSIVDMNLAAGLGSVTVKNASLYAPSCEKIAATSHCNGLDYWVVSHDMNSNVFRSYLLSSAGINTLSPVLSTVGTTFTGLGFAGQLKVSPNGKKLGTAIPETASGAQGGFEIYDFDPATGVVSNPLFLDSCVYAYGCEFSPDGTKFYGASLSNNEIFQWDLCAGSHLNIIGSKYTTTVNASGNFGSFQLAPNGKIYIALGSTSSISIIDNPNANGAACNYVHAAQSTAPNQTMLGLPNFVSSILRPSPSPFTYTLSCQTASFTAGTVPTHTGTGCSAINYPLNSVQWVFGDPASGAANSSTLSNPTHVFSGNGTYTVKCIYNYQCSSDTTRQIVMINSLPSLSVTGTFTICKGEKRTYTASGATSYSWNISNNMGAGTPSISLSPTANVTGTVTGVSGSCVSVKTFSIKVNPCTDLQEHTSNTHFRVFPNPFSDSFTIESEEGGLMYLISPEGRMVMKTLLNPGSNTLHLTGLAEGLYFIRYTNGNSLITYKVIKRSEP